MAASTHMLAEDVFLCLSESRLVFLDLKRDEYSCLNQKDTQTAIQLFGGLSGSNTVPQEQEVEVEQARERANASRVIQTLTDAQLLAKGESKGKKATPVRVQTPTESILLDGRLAKPTVRPGHWAAFFRASLVASLKLRWYSMQRTVRSVENRKLRASGTKRRVERLQTAEQNLLRDLVTVFHHLRPYYGRKYLCLYDSLALVEFLAHYYIYPQWVFGVTAEPFNAHCWVQEDECVLNDSVERVCCYTPIMEV